MPATETDRDLIADDLGNLPSYATHGVPAIDLAQRFLAATKLATAPAGLADSLEPLLQLGVGRTARRYSGLMMDVVSTAAVVGHLRRTGHLKEVVRDLLPGEFFVPDEETPELTQATAAWMAANQRLETFVATVREVAGAEYDRLCAEIRKASA